MKLKIGIFGRVNAGKSTLLNALTDQQVAIVSPQRGTTTDPVRRAYELEGVGAVTFIDTAGIDDTSPLGVERVRKSVEVLQEVDVVIFVRMGGGEDGIDSVERGFLEGVSVPMLMVDRGERGEEEEGVESIRARLVDTIKRSGVGVEKPFFGDMLIGGDTVVLVCPIDSSAPTGRMILPQVQAIRSALDIGAMAVVVQPSELPTAIQRYTPQLVVTDSQAFDTVRKVVPLTTPLTSFSILLAQRYADIKLYTRGLNAVKDFAPNSKILLVEYCSHTVTCEDIGRVKIPRLLEQRLGFHITVDIISGRDPLPRTMADYSLVVQCGGCMVGDSGRMIKSRIEECRKQKIPITNYGLLLRHLLL